MAEPSADANTKPGAKRDEKGTLQERIAYMLWQANEGYILAEDRAIGTNWFAQSVEEQHPDDQAERPGWMAMADEILRAIWLEIQAAATGKGAENDG